MRLVFRPLDEWPGPKTARPQRSQFSAGWTDTTELLEREITHLRDRSTRQDEVLIQVDAPESAMRLDGGIRADARVGFHGVIISFESKHGFLSYPCDNFDQPSFARRGDSPWKDNVRAIAKGLEHLRHVERYGIANSGQQYTGWKALGAGTPLPPAQMTLDEAARIIGRYNGLAGDVTVERVQHGLSDLYKEAARKVHPDAGGDAAAFQELREAHDLLAGAL